MTWVIVLHERKKNGSCRVQGPFSSKKEASVNEMYWTDDE